MQSTDVISVASEHVLSDGWGRLTKYEFDIRRRDGDVQRQIREVYDHGDGTTCLLYNSQTECVLLTRQFRLPAFLNGGGDALIEAPAGLLDGARPADRMRSELVEETGYEVSGLDHLFDVFMSPGSVTESLAFFVGSFSESEKVSAGGGQIEEGEDIEVLHVPLDDAMAMVEDGRIRDAKTIILLQHLTIQKMRQASR